MNKKGFTLVELLGVIIILAIIGTIAAISVNTLIERGKIGIYKNYESTLKSSASNYLISNSDELPNIGSSIDISVTTLVNSKFIDELEDPKNKSDKCTSSYVRVTRDVNVSNNYNLTYKICLICGTNYISEGC